MSGDTTGARMREVQRVLNRSPAEPADAEQVERLRRLVEDMTRDGIGRDDPVREICGRVGDRWSTLLLLILRTGSLRYSQLQRLVEVVSAEGGISQRMLTLRLKALERDGLVERQVTPSIPPRVDYQITPLGAGLAQQVGALIAWVSASSDEIRAARRRFEAEDD